MSKHNILCTICKQVLKSTEDICSTNCGHVFHFVCMSEYQHQSTCPECQHNNPTTNKLHLFFDERNDENVVNNWKYKTKIIELHKQIEDGKSDYLHLQEKYLISQDALRKLEGRIKKSDHNISQRRVILTDLEDRIKTLEELNQYLTIDNECKSEALTSKSNEITRLKNSAMTLEKQNLSATALNEQIYVLEQNFNDQSIQLDREVAKCSQLSRDKEKLQQHIDLMKLDIGKEASTKSKKKKITKVACDFDSFKSPENVLEDNITDSSVPDVVPFFTKYSIINGHPFNNYFNKVFIKTHQTKQETVQTCKHQISSNAKVKLIFRKLRNKCLVCSTVLIFIFLMSNVTSVD